MASTPVLPPGVTPKPQWAQAGTHVLYLHLAPDGSGVAFKTTRTAGFSDLVLGDVLGGHLAWTRRLQPTDPSQSLSAITDLRWSPHGGSPRYVYRALGAGDAAPLFTSAGLVLESYVVDAPAWDPTQERLVVADRQGLLLRGRTPGEPAQRITTGDHRDATFLPDGSAVTYVDVKPTGAAVALVDLQQSASHELVGFEGSQVVRPSPSPDGRTLAFLERPGVTGDWSLWTVSRSLQEPPTRHPGHYALPHSGPIPWVPDGSSVLLSSGSSSRDSCIARVPMDGSGPTCLDLGTTGDRAPEVVPTAGGWLLGWTADSPDPTAAGTGLYLQTVEPF